ncbi:MAG: lipoprotein, RlpA family [Nitrospirae bacterium]|nr:lipoprotein, RlpA family [Nitrospirota bacterium]
MHTKAYPSPVYDKTYAVASWYGPQFHGRPTSSGEIFNMHAKTCAHKEYPFGTRVQVTNIINNRSAECIVNDRGPFVEGRDIDLSYAMAKEIELIGLGTGMVLLEVNGRDSSYIRPVKFQTSEKTGLFAIQVGAFTENINAIQLKVALNLKYPNVYIQETEVKGITYYRVRVGNYGDYKSALAVAEQLGQEGYQALLMRADVKI